MAAKRGLRTIKKVAKVVREASSKNPPFWSSAFFYVAPAIGGYAVTRLAGRAARTYLAPRWPQARRFLPVAGSVLAGGALFAAVSYVGALKKYRVQVMAGVGVALAQSLLLAVAPQFGWLFDMGGSRPALPVAPQAALTSQDAELDALEAQAVAQMPVPAAGEPDAFGEPEAMDDDLGPGWGSPLN
jgi:hypothetical protein